LKTRFAALLLGCALDLLLGDPHRAPHPVRAIGALVSSLERPLRAMFPKSARGETAAGAALAVLVLAVSAGLAGTLLSLAGRLSRWLSFALETLLCYQCLAARSLRDESMRVYRALQEGTLDGARRAVSMIVGRDVNRLDKTGVAKAAVETVAENASDGVIAPLLFLALGGAPLGIAYKAVNTMDSMVGYRNERYRHYGTCAARLDDLLNLLPARISGVLMCLAAPLAGLDGKNARRVFRRDRRNHASPNSAHTEAAAAGALHVQLAGNAWYFGALVEKPAIGDADRPIEPEDIVRVNRLMLTAAALAAALFCVLPLMLILIFD